MEFLSDYILPVVLGICLCTGFIIKKWIKDVHNKYIPTILSILGVILSLWIHQFVLSPEVILSGFISGLASTGMYELFRQYIENNT